MRPPCRSFMVLLGAIAVECAVLALPVHAEPDPGEAPAALSPEEPSIEAEAEAQVEAKGEGNTDTEAQKESEPSSAGEPALPEVGLDAPERAPPSGVDEMTIRGRRRGDLLRERPEAVTGFSADDLELRSISNLSEIANSTPSLVLDRMAGSANNARIFIRGIGQDDAISTADPGVGLYVDGVYMGRSFGALMDLFDLQSVEVLRGPQSRPFGRNSIGGAINLVSTLPSFGRDVEGRLTLGSDGYRQGKFIIDFPMVEDTLAGRLSLITTRSQGYTEDRLHDQTLDDENLNGGRLSLQWMPTEYLDLALHLNGTRERTGSVGFEILSVKSNASLIEASLDLPDCSLIQVRPQLTAGECLAAGKVLRQDYAAQIDDEIHSVEQNEPSQTDFNNWGGTLIGTLELPFAQLKSITGYSGLDGDFTLDLDGTKFTGLSTVQHQEQWQLSQELQFSGTAIGGRFEWLGGLYGFEEEVDDTGSLGIFSDVSQGVRNFRSSITNQIRVIPDFLWNTGFLPVDKPPEPFNLEDLERPPLGQLGLWNVLTRGFAGCTREPVLGIPIPPTATDWTDRANPCGLVEFELASSLLETIRDLQNETDIDTQNNTKNRTASAYTWARWKFDERWSASLGLRYSYDDKNLFRDSSFQPSGTAILPGVTTKGHWEDWSPSLVLQYRHSEELAGYVKVAKGYKPGGFNGRTACPGNPLTTVDCPVGVAESILVPFEPETSWTYELGMRTSWLDGRLILDGTFFYNVYEDRQVSQLRFVGGEIQNDTINAGRAIIQGFELEAESSPWSGLYLDLSASLVNGRYLEFDNAVRNPGLDPHEVQNPAVIEALAFLFGVQELVSGEHLHMKDLPTFQGSIGITYEQPLSEWGILRHWVGYRYQSRIFYNTENTLMQGGYGILDTRLAFENLEGNWRAAVFVKNLLNREYIQNGIDLRDTIGFATVQYGAPRFVGVELIHEF